MASKRIKVNVGVSFITLLLSTLFLIGFSISGSYAYEALTTTSNLLDQGAMIANISVSEHTVEDAKIVLNEKVNNWKETKVVSFQFKNREVTASVEELFFFDIDQSIELAKKQSQTPMITQLLDYQLNDVIFQLAGEDILFKLNREQLEQDLLMYASYLSPENKQINIHDYIYDHLKEEVTISKSELDVLEHGSYFYLNQIVESLNGYNIEPNETVSLLSILNEHSLNSPNDEISIVASVLYNVLMHTNFDILERHISQSLPSYSELGFEAFVSYPHHDLRFTNPNYVPYTVTAEIDSHVLKISLVGDPLEYRYEVKLLEEQTFSPKTIVHFSEELEPGRFRIEFVGEKGFAAMVMREEYTNESTLVRSILLSEDFYRPVHQIVVQSIKDKPESTDDSGVSPIPGFIDPNDQDNQDDNIDKGIEEDDEKIKGYY